MDLREIEAELRGLNAGTEIHENGRLGARTPYEDGDMKWPEKPQPKYRGVAE